MGNESTEETISPTLEMNGKKTNREMSTVILLIFLPIVLFFASFLIGRYPVSPLDVIMAILPVKTHLSPEIYTVVWNIRLPRILAAMVVGASLSMAGASFQGTFKNPLVSPDILGVSAGAGFGAAIAILLNSSPLVLQIMAFSFGLIAVSLTYFISRRLRGNVILMMVLGGMAMGAMFTAFISCIKYLADPNNQLPEIVYWLMGSLNNVTGSNLIMILFPVVVGFTILLLVRWKLNLLSMGDEEAKALGIDTEKLRIIVIACCTLLTAAAVSISGIIGWVGLVIPHICRIIVGPDHRKLLPATISVGAFFLLFIDDICRTAFPVEIPLGILTAIIGAPFFIYLLRKGYGGWS